MAKLIRLTESDVRNMIRATLNSVLRESNGDWKAAYDKFNREGGDINDYLNLARDEFGGDEKARIKALNKHIKDNDARRELRMSPEELAKEKAWEKKYNREHNINVTDDDDSDLDDFEAEKQRQWLNRARKKAPKRPSVSQEEPTRSPEEILAQMKELGFLK